MFLTPFSSSQKDFKCSWKNWHIFRPNWIDYINLSKVLDNYMSRCKCTGCSSRGGIRLVGDISFSLKNISSFMKHHTYVKHHETKCKAQEQQLCIAYFWSYCPLNIENCLHGNTDFHQAIFVWKTMKTLLSLHRCAFTLESPMSTYPISTIITWTGLFFVISLPLWLYMLLIILIIFHFSP